MGKSKSPWKPTLRLSIRVVLTVMIFLTAGIITLTSYLASRSALLSFSRDLVDKNAEMVRLQVVGYITPAKRAAELAFALARDRTVPVEDFARLERYFFDYLSVHRTMCMLYYGSEKGDFLLMKRLPDGSLSTKIVTGEGEARRVLWRHRGPGARFDQILRADTDPSDPYDPRVRPWYVGARRDRGLHWTDVYIFYSGKQPGITASVPLYRSDGPLSGVIAVDIGLTDVSRFLKERIRVGASGQALLLDRTGRMIASRQVDELTIPDKNEPVTGARLRRIEESSLPEIAALANVTAFRERCRRLYEGATKERSVEADPDRTNGPTSEPIRYSVRGVDYIAKVEPIDIGGRRWLVAVVAAEDEFLVEAKRANVRNALTAGLLTLVAVAVGGVVATLVVRSLGLLVRETKRLERLEFVDEGPMSSRFLEVHQTLEAFKRMKTGLRAFGKYVPMTLVRQLLERGVEPRPGAATMELTLFFSDIRNFTPQSERMTPMELAEWLSRYLSTVTECVHSHNGTVDKYLGDGVVAFWGAPADVPDHAAETCMAALECTQCVAELGKKAPGDMDFYTRIGIHTATVAVGNFGSADRLNYTAIGDGVNLASRLEGANKVFGTQILISGDTHSRVAGRFETRKLGLVAVKGRGGACAVHELMGEKGRVAEDRVARARRYERALELFLSRKWDQAAAALARLLEEDPDDRSYTFLAEACRGCAEGPALPDRDGVFTITTK